MAKFTVSTNNGQYVVEADHYKVVGSHVEFFDNYDEKYAQSVALFSQGQFLTIIKGEPKAPEPISDDIPF